MRIGIDGSALTKNQPTGVEVVTRELIIALLKLDTQNQYFIYTSLALPRVFLEFPQVVNRVVPVSRFWTWRSLPQALQRDSLDVFWSPSNMLPPGLPAKSLATVHDLAFMRFPRHYRLKERFLSWLTVNRAARAATNIIAVSNQTRQDLMKYFKIPATKIKVVYGALPSLCQQVNRVEIKHKYNLPDDFLLTVGRLEPRKNSFNIIRTYALIAKDYPQLKLVMVGPKGYYFPQVNRLIKTLGLGDRVMFLDFVPTADLFAIYQSARMLLFPSLYEGFGIPILEAWAAHTPVITSNLGAMSEVAGDAAVLVDPTNPEAMADQIRLLLKDEGLRTRYSQLGASRLRNFSWSHSAKKLKEIIHHL